MALIACPECSQQMSKSAAACPHCGAPNKKAKDSKQAMGCLFVLLAIPIGLFMPPLGIVVGIVGVVIMLLNTRLS